MTRVGSLLSGLEAADVAAKFNVKENIRQTIFMKASDVKCFLHIFLYLKQTLFNFSIFSIPVF